MTTARLLSRGVRTLSNTEQSLGSFIFGAASLGELLGVGGIASETLALLPQVVGMGCTFDMLRAIDEMCHTSQGMQANWSTYSRSLIRIAANGIADVLSYEHLHQSMSLTSTAFGTMCGIAALRAFGNLIADVWYYRELNEKIKKKYENRLYLYMTKEKRLQLDEQLDEAYKKAWISGLTFIGWALLASAN